MTAFVYLIEDAGLYKIGRSVHPSQRLVEVTKNPDARLVHMISSTIACRIESVLHRRFHGCRERGEWFRLTPEDVAAIRVVSTANRVEELPDDLRRSQRPPKVTYAFRLSGIVHDAIKRAAKKHRRSVPTEILIAVEEYLARQ